MVASVQKGDEVITAGGIFGKVTKVVAGEEGDSLNKVMVKIADGVEIAVQQNTIGRVLTERTPAKTEEQTSAKASKKAAPKAANDNR
jgi:preprotein translocase subunit YajC